MMPVFDFLSPSIFGDPEYLKRRPSRKEGDTVEIFYGRLKGRRGVITRGYTVRNEEERRAGKTGNIYYDVDIGNDIVKCHEDWLATADILDVLADAGSDS